MKAIISDSSKFEKYDIQEENCLNFILYKRKTFEIIKPMYEEGLFTKSHYLKIWPSR